MVEELRKKSIKVNEIPHLREHTLALIQLVRTMREEIRKVTEDHSAIVGSGENLSKLPILNDLKEIENKAKAGLFSFLKRPTIMNG